MRGKLAQIALAGCCKRPWLPGPAEKNRIMNERTQHLAESKKVTIFGISGIPATRSK
jgi:hypothetical protein